jgi:hypothetical protein
MSNYDIFLPRITITNLDTTETMKQKITVTIRNMHIGDIVLFDLFFSKKHNNHYAFITLALYDNLPATHFARTIAERGFAKLWDKDYYWKVVKYIDPDLRRPSVVLNTAFIQEDDVVIDVLPKDDLDERLFAEEYAGVLEESVFEDIDVFEQDLSVDEPVLSLDKYALEKLREWEDPDDDYPYEYGNHDYEEERPSIFSQEDYSAFYGPDVVDDEPEVVVEQEMMSEHKSYDELFAGLPKRAGISTSGNAGASVCQASARHKHFKKCGRILQTFPEQPFEYAYHNLMNERTLMFPEWLHKPFPVPNCLLFKEETSLENDFEMFARRVLGRSLFEEVCSV